MRKFKERLRAVQERLGIKPGLVPPIIFDTWVSRNPDGSIAESIEASIEDGPRIPRDPGETLEQFKTRLIAMLPHESVPSTRVIELFGPPDHRPADEDPPEDQSATPQRPERSF
jgi:hypothetical protein